MTHTTDVTSARAAEDVLDPRADTTRAAKELAAAITQTAEFTAFERAFLRLREDGRAQQALVAFETKQQELQAVLMLGAASEEEHAELERLRQAWMDEASVTEYLNAQASLAALSQAVDRHLSDRIGLGFAAACRPSCCG
jgi:cell fate (sporulation/competence/biofilm development) regulator YlbF (YheA/YmcA/DUF963 family)